MSTGWLSTFQDYASLRFDIRSRSGGHFNNEFIRSIFFQRIFIAIYFSKDVNGVAQHILRLRHVYDLTLDHVLEGRVLGLVAVRGMRVSECFLMANVAYKNALMPQEFKVWYQACQTVRYGNTCCGVFKGGIQR